MTEVFKQGGSVAHFVRNGMAEVPEGRGSCIKTKYFMKKNVLLPPQLRRDDIVH